MRETEGGRRVREGESVEWKVVQGGRPRRELESGPKFTDGVSVNRPRCTMKVSEVTSGKHHRVNQHIGKEAKFDLNEGPGVKKQLKEGNKSYASAVKNPRGAFQRKVDRVDQFDRVQMYNFSCKSYGKEVAKLSNAYVWKLLKKGTTTVDASLGGYSVWFSQIVKWEPSTIDSERLVWLKCFGTPLHAWNVNFFSQIAGFYGDFRFLDEATVRKDRYDVVRFALSSTRVEQALQS
ncbi:hypothetical protein VNO78_06309 [Psophocarpus tetragonolobus]|uniref:DUF4283 domain-containing protein n=1 Tax=Psophocarpus tetragonolobus TaxID=3891 RepID=A0AAN9XRG2_PSOTE